MCDEKLPEGERRGAALLRARNAVFYLLLVFFALLILAIAMPGIGLRGLPGFLIISLAVVLTVLGAALVVLTAKQKESRFEKTVFMVTGASAAGMPLFAVLHNVVYALCILCFGEGFWDTRGTDEPFFFLLAIVVCPALFIVGAAIGVVLRMRTRKSGIRDVL